jgi:hypothetical protein
MTQPPGRKIPHGSRATSGTWKNTILQSHGRLVQRPDFVDELLVCTEIDLMMFSAPWYTQDGKHIGNAFVIGIGGGSASGKVNIKIYLRILVD